MASVRKMTWEDRGNYWHYIVDQGSDSEKWLEARKGRCTGTTTNGESSFGETKEDIADRIAGNKIKEFTGEQKENIDRGVEKEPIVRGWYGNTYKIKVIEMGFCVPKDFPEIMGVSVDGMVDGKDGIIEIKCPKRMYGPLIKRMYFKGKVSGYNHIWKSHYKQMQMGMGILGKKWCDYIVYSEDGKVYVERIPFDGDFWNTLKEEIKTFWKDYVYPLIKDTNYPVMPLNY